MFFPADAVDPAPPTSLVSWRTHPLLSPFVGSARGGAQRLHVPPADRRPGSATSPTSTPSCASRRDGYADAARAHLTLLLVQPRPPPAGTARPRRRSSRCSPRCSTSIDDRYHEPISLRDVADAVGLTPGHLTTAIGRRTGRTVQQWITERRMREARRLLADTDLAVGRDRATGVGYREAGYFVRRFRAAHGVPPAAWRRAGGRAPNRRNRVAIDRTRWTRMEVVPHTDAGAFARLARPLLEADPVRHTSVLTVLDGVQTGAFEPAAMLTVHENGAVVGALLRTADARRWSRRSRRGAPARSSTPWSALDLEVEGVQGPAEEAEAVAAAWSARTGAGASVGLRMRLFALDELAPPAGVARGGPRSSARTTRRGLDVLARVAAEFDARDRPHLAAPAHGPRRRRARRGDGAGELLWEVDGEPVAQAAARAVVAGMSRIGPVYTPPEHRGHGYAAAVTAAAARWALGSGARHVLLYTDLANPTTNRLYPRLGFRPRYDALELRFEPARCGA